MSIFAARDSLVSSELLAHASESVVYTRGANSVTVSAVIGRTAFWGEGSSSAFDQKESRDFLIKASDLVLNGSTVTPVAGDTITDAAGAWVAQPIGSEPLPWNYSDASRTVIRVHCWQGY